MKNYLNVMKKSALFHGIEVNEIDSMLSCLSAQYSAYSKGQTIYRNSESISTVGMVLSGSVHIVKEDFWGNRSIIAGISSSELFGETYACIPTESLGISVIAAEPVEVLFLNIHKVMTVCTSGCEFHAKLIRNLLSILAEKNIMLTKKIEYMAKRTTREKLLSYLSAESLKNNNPSFEIPFNRQQLADYLCVDRSAMSNELCKLRDEGILSFHKNIFHLKEKEHGDYC